MKESQRESTGVNGGQRDRTMLGDYTAGGYSYTRKTAQVLAWENAPKSSRASFRRMDGCSFWLQVLLQTDGYYA